MHLTHTILQVLIKRGGLAVEVGILGLAGNAGYATPGEYIRSARVQQGLRQKDLATLVGVHQATVKTWEASIKYPHQQQWDKLIEALNLSRGIVHELLLEAASNKNSDHMVD